MLEKYYFIKLEFEVLQNIGSLPFFHGPMWSAFLRNACRGSGLKYQNEFPFRVNPADQGIVEYMQGDVISTGISFPSSEMSSFEKLYEFLADNKTTSDFHGHFIPGKTCLFKNAECRINSSSKTGEFSPIDAGVFNDLFPVIKNHESMNIIFYTPFRVFRKSENRKPGHSFIDESWFIENLSPLERVFEQVFTKYQSHDFILENFNLKWIDVPWGADSNAKTTGGIAGYVRTRVPAFTPDSFSDFIMAGYRGIGRNTALGLGLYEIPELEEISPVSKLPRYRTVFKSAVDAMVLHSFLPSLKDKTPGPDGIGVDSIISAGVSGLDFFCSQIKAGQYKFEKPSIHEFEKPEGGVRVIHISNIFDRLLEKSVSSYLVKVTEKLLSPFNYAYRAEHNTSGAIESYLKLFSDGFYFGLKLDIKSFFDSIDIRSILKLLTALFHEDPVVELIHKLYHASSSFSGLNQGNALSPVLSNLYMDVFDRIVSVRWPIVRYSDDFIILCKSSDEINEIYEYAGGILDKMGLSLHPSKRTDISPDTQFKFLGTLIKSGQIHPPVDEDTSSVFPVNEGWRGIYNAVDTGHRTVYITSRVLKVQAINNNLVLEKYDQPKELIPFMKIRQIIVVGKQRLTGGVFSRCLEHGIPVFFQYLSGDISAQFITNRQKYRTPAHITQYHMFSDPEYCFSWAKNIVNAKLMNSMAVLRRKGKNQKNPDWFYDIKDRLAIVTSMDELRGVEGYFSKLYFNTLSEFFSPFEFKGRIYHPPDGPVNAMLSFGYTLIYHRLNCALIRAGLDTRAGFMHVQHGRHAALASDLMEELRYFIDRTVISMISNGEITPDDFHDNPRSLSGKSFQAYIARFESSMDRRFKSSFSNIQINMNEYLEEMSDSVTVALRLGMVYEPRIVR
ncbi:MAG: CRISPR-associated endonuclease Cas1 [Deltaproteobacteria bacterium]|nr:CRISPR-associated endonuclease Cas1 [Deltaproteobacteria bacterium]